ncbi:MAG: T9SS type A sorting domain-containing protein [Sphingobacteriales bacterium]|nr:MAG: T9SS type A sorting domain-containing protein [Sphingobacteriales bacterium]
MRHLDAYDMKTFTKLYISLFFLTTLYATPASACLTIAKADKTSSLGVNQSESLVSIFPNPNKGIAKIQVNLPTEGTAKIRFSNTIGKVVKVVDLSAVTTGNIVPLDLTNLPAGVYFYSVLVNDKLMETKRMILEN